MKTPTYILMYMLICRDVYIQVCMYMYMPTITLAYQFILIYGDDNAMMIVMIIVVLPLEGIYVIEHLYRYIHTLI